MEEPGWRKHLRSQIGLIWCFNFASFGTLLFIILMVGLSTIPPDRNGLQKQLETEINAITAINRLDIEILKNSLMPACFKGKKY